MMPRTLPILLVASLAAPLHGEIIERVVAKVNGEVLTLSEFEARQVAAVQAARVGADGVERFLRDNNQRILQEAIDDLLLIQRAREIGLRVRPEYLDGVLEDIKKEHGITTEEAFQEQLRREGLTVGEFKRNIERSMLRRQVVAREVESRVTISDAEARAEYDAHREDYYVPASVHLHEIVLEGPDAETRARTLAERLAKGEDFAALARQHSVAGSAKDGGDLGRVARGDLAADLAKIVFDLPVGAVSPPQATTTGVRLLKVVAKTEAGQTSFEAARPLLLQRLQQARLPQAVEEYLAGLRKTAGTIDVRVREVPLQVAVPEVPAGGVLAAPGGPAAPAASGDDEFSTTPQTKPERIAPEPSPQATPPPPVDIA
jgi:parvulin-like peptidyl-prolyl isomerase